jgi:hypothetical protein
MLPAPVLEVTVVPVVAVMLVVLAVTVNGALTHEQVEAEAAMVVLVVAEKLIIPEPLEQVPQLA